MRFATFYIFHVNQAHCYIISFVITFAWRLHQNRNSANWSCMVGELERVRQVTTTKTGHAEQWLPNDLLSRKTHTNRHVLYRMKNLNLRQLWSQQTGLLVIFVSVGSRQSVCLVSSVVLCLASTPFRELTFQERLTNYFLGYGRHSGMRVPL